MAIVNIDNFTPSNGAIEAMSDILFERLLGNESVLGQTLNVMLGQKHGKKLGLIMRLGLKGKAGGGCSPSYDKFAANGVEKSWDLPIWAINEELCANDLRSTAFKFALKSGIDMNNLQDTEYVNEIVIPLFEGAIYDALFRFVWFGDKSADTTANSGVLKVGTDKDYFNLTDGLFKHLYSATTADATRRTTIAANNEATIDEQLAAMRVKGVAIATIDSVIQDAPMDLRAQQGTIYLTQMMADTLTSDLKAANRGSEMAFTSDIEGVKLATYDGIKVVVLPQWDFIIKSYEGTTTKYNNPFRIIYTTQDNLLVGTEETTAMALVDFFFDKKTEMNYIKSKGTIGALVANDKLFQFGY